MLVNTLHAHNSFLLLAIKHQILPMDMALSRDIILISSTAGRIFVLLFRIDACLTTSLGYIGRFPISPDIRKPLAI